MKVHWVQRSLAFGVGTLRWLTSLTWRRRGWCKSSRNSWRSSGGHPRLHWLTVQPSLSRTVGGQFGGHPRRLGRASGPPRADLDVDLEAKGWDVVFVEHSNIWCNWTLLEPLTTPWRWWTLPTTSWLRTSDSNLWKLMSKMQIFQLDFNILHSKWPKKLQFDLVSSL